MTLGPEQALSSPGQALYVPEGFILASGLFALGYRPGIGHMGSYLDIAYMSLPCIYGYTAYAVQACIRGILAYVHSRC